MRKAEIFIHGKTTGFLYEITSSDYRFEYLEAYQGEPISLTMPIHQKNYIFKSFPPFFDGLLPEGMQLESLLRLLKIDKFDYFSQLCAVGEDLIGAVTVKEIK